MILVTSYSFGQISPGKLSDAHAHLEGMANCTQCHDLGNKVPNQKCLDCHQEIDNLISSNRGYHVSNEVTSKACVDCHNDHHGRKFEMVRFDEENFNHQLVGYILEGAHSKIECRDCHIPDYISDPELQKREKTFLGMDKKCLSCHDDFHQETLSSNCIECHTMETFRPADLFNHDDSKFALKGQHINVSCLECHPTSLRNGQEFQQFTGLKFNDCISCHNDPHLSKLPGRCNQCHIESSFINSGAEKRFNHNNTAFTLKGDHRNLQCFECHSETNQTSELFQDLINISSDNCVACHDDIHDGKFGSNCIQCHSEEGFLELKTMDFFDHDVTDFPLRGNHIGVDCNACHSERYTQSIDFSACKNCHDDYHNKEFAVGGISPDCNECHTIEEPFSYTTFGPEEHESASFQLEGAHLATPCFSCHISEDHWSFRNIGEACIDCHQDIHVDYISPQYYPESDCTNCHNTDSWTSISFDHSATKWNLRGAHISVDCRSCHFELNPNNDKFEQHFKGLNSECAQCHDNVHGSQFEKEGITDCNRCHTSESWSPDSFNHNNTMFPLEGKHLELECNACHFSEENDSGKVEIKYKIEKFECIDCHT